MTTLTFGKHVGLPVSAVLQIDPGWCEWFIVQNDVEFKYPEIVKEIKAGLTKTVGTPEHNRVQAVFADKEFARAFLVKAFGKDPQDSTYDDVGVTVEFEKHGFDVLITGGRGDKKKRLGVEVKPTIGDDYPAVLRQVNKAGLHHTGASLVDKRAVAYDTFNKSSVPFDTITTIFESSNVALISVNDLDLVTY